MIGDSRCGHPAPGNPLLGRRPPSPARAAAPNSPVNPPAHLPILSRATASAPHLHGILPPAPSVGLAHAIASGLSLVRCRRSRPGLWVLAILFPHSRHRPAPHHGRGNHAVRRTRVVEAHRAQLPVLARQGNPSRSGTGKFRAGHHHRAHDFTAEGTPGTAPARHRVPLSVGRTVHRLGRERVERSHDRRPATPFRRRSCGRAGRHHRPRGHRRIGFRLRGPATPGVPAALRAVRRLRTTSPPAQHLQRRTSTTTPAVRPGKHSPWRPAILGAPGTITNNPKRGIRISAPFGPRRRPHTTRRIRDLRSGLATSSIPSPQSYCSSASIWMPPPGNRRSRDRVSPCRAGRRCCSS
jgi:hypothetical protein